MQAILKPGLREWAVAVAAGTSMIATTAVVALAASHTDAPPTPVLSGTLPLDIDVPDSVTSDVDARPYFDTFSWQSFIALNWPADPNAKGTPLTPDDPITFTSPPAGSRTVWESYAASFELFGTGDDAPKPWGETSAASGDPCATGTDAKVLHMVAKGADVLDEVNEAFSHPLIDQNGNYVYAEVLFNEAYYEFVRSNEYYLAKNIPLPSAPPMQMPASTTDPDKIGAVMIKAAWRIMTDNDQQDRYHVVDAVVVDPDGDACTVQKVGLVGLHIAQKLKTFPEWIWTSFEQVDNIERGPGATDDTPISFNNGTDTPATPRGWANRPPKVPPMLPASQRTPVQVTRLNEIPTTPPGFSTVDLNTTYQALVTGTPFEYYQLIITQWPTQPQTFTLMDNGGVYPGDAGQPFPVNGATNVAMETYFQSQTDATGAGGNSCMQCHYGAGITDFSWILRNDSH